jgi:sugar lactone lactonase YvrE
MAKRLLTGLLLLSALAFPLFAVWNDHRVERFATLPNERDAPRFPEGIAADAGGRIYVATFDFERPVVYVFEPGGKLRHTIALPAGTIPLGLEIDHRGRLYVANFARGTVMRYSQPLQASGKPDAEFSVCAVERGCGVSALAFDTKGDLYVSDSLGGHVFRIELRGGTASIFLSDELLRPGDGFPLLGANGLAFDAGGKRLYVANSARHSVLRYDLGTQELDVFAQGIDGADGIVFDRKGRLWVAASQVHEVLALDETGTVIERVGSFDRSPASIAVSGGHVYVTKLGFYTVSRFRLRGDKS